LRILHVAPKFDYGIPEQGLGFEHYTFYDFFRASGHEVVDFDSVGLLQSLGREAADHRLLEAVETEKPDLMFTVLMLDELNRDVVRSITENTKTVTLNWFCDDHWRFDNYSRFWAPCFDWVVTTAKSAILKYERLPYPHAIKSQWGCNTFLYRKIDLPPRYDVSFVGQSHGDRRAIVEALRTNDIEVHTFGAGWPRGRVSQDEMIRIFNQSRINLNFSNASATENEHRKGALEGRLSRVGKVLDRVAFGGLIKKGGRALLDGYVRMTARGRDQGEYVQQIKARNFEVPGCGGFLLTGNAEDLDLYYKIGKEIVCFDDTRHLVETIKHYLSHEEERAAVAQAGYERTLRDHTYTQRFAEIFARIGLPNV
jgi:spore maturation protein CgeB